MFMSAKLEEFRLNYLQICSEKSIDPQLCVLDALERSQLASSSLGHVLDLTSHHIEEDSAAALGESLKKDCCFSEINFNECCLPDKSLRHILIGLSINTSCQRLTLKGNRISGESVRVLALFLRKNKTVKELDLQWNHLGDNEDAFAVLCDSLVTNVGLHILDLKNNRLNAECARCLATVVKRNKILQVIDLQWNNIGVHGGEAILESIKYNRNILSFLVIGNKIPEHLMSAIESCIEKNQELNHSNAQSNGKLDILTDALQKDFMERESRQSMSQQLQQHHQQQSQRNLNSSSTKSDIARLKQSGRAHDIIAKLEEIIRDRSQAFNLLSAKLAMVESQLEVSEARGQELTTMLQHYEQDKASELGQMDKQLKDEKNSRMETEKRLLKEQMDLQGKINSLENEKTELEAKVKQQREQLFDSREKLTQMQAEVKLKQAQFDEKLSSERQKCKENIRHVEEEKSAEINKLRDDWQNAIQNWQEKFNRSEQNRRELETQIGKLENQIESERNQVVEQVNVTKNRMREEKNQIVQQSENKIRYLEQTQQEQETQINRLKEEIIELQKKNNQITLQNNNQKRRLDAMELEISNKDSEVSTAVNRCKHEWEEKLKRVEAELDLMKDVQDKMTQTQRQLENDRRNFQEEKNEQTRTIGNLKSKLATSEAELKRLVEDEQKRLLAFRTAVQHYTESPLLQKLTTDNLPVR